MDESRYAAYLEAAETLSAEYCAGYRLGLKTYVSLEPLPSPAPVGADAPAETRKGYKDGFAGKPPRGFHHNIGNRYAASEQADSQLHVRLPSATKAGYVKTAQAEGLKLSEWVLRELDRAVARQKRRLRSEADE